MDDIEEKDKGGAEAGSAESVVYVVDVHPDGGLRAWLVILGVATGVCGTFGLVNAWGVFQAYYENDLLRDSSPSNIAWIGSLQYALNFLPGLAVGRLFDMGWFFAPLCSASALLVAATVLTGECTQYWQFLLCQGFAIGLACGVQVFNEILATPAHWFRHRLGIALGFSSIGDSIGGTVFPIVARTLIQNVGFRWTMRVIGLVELVLLTVTILTVRRRVHPTGAGGPFIDFRAFASKPYMLYCAANFVTFLGLYTVLTYISVSATQAGVSTNLSAYLVAIANGCSIIGRLSGGFFADKIGPLSVMIPATFVSGILTYAWPFATSAGSLIAVAVVYGTSNGVFVSLVPAPIMRMKFAGTGRIGMLLGMNSTLTAFGAVAGPPISGAIYAAAGYTFTFVGVYAGSTVMLAVALLVATRLALTGRAGVLGRC
ncbi:MFS general substrate transporter [Lentinus brumalis]|uniref:MFS general substrate transporter n=1 Tax=Lentinus brumalis TaxID=2498619 RepID=A0A371DIP3_9APHY|nr:MFS general substrate transporter [Polyporus brumalis]